jgi:alkylated DNA repair protein alkB family protein 4
MNALEYKEEEGSGIDPHFDDFWLWGERIVGISLLEDTTMTFYKTFEHQIDHLDVKVYIEIEVPLPAGSVYLMTKSSRFEWQHGINKKHIKGRRMVTTFRELTHELLETDIGQEMIQVAR